jgi:capsular polysaccharide biosynthesis protein
MENREIENNEVSLVDLYKIIRYNFITIIILTLLFGLLAAIYAFIVASPKYKSEAFVLVQVQVESQTGSGFDLVNASRLLETAKELMSMPVVLDEVIDKLSLDITVTELKKNLTVTSSSTSYFINVSYISENPIESKEIVNEVINEAIKFADNHLLILEENIIRTSFANDGLYDSPNKVLYIIIGVILGVILGVGLTFLKEMFNNTFRTKEQLEAYFGIQVLGVIPEFEVKEIK